MTDWHFSPGQHFQCSQCSRCCRGWRIHVDATTAQNLKSTPHKKKLEEREGRFFARKDKDERCSFLTPQNLCQLHVEGGPSTKPRGCRQFPFRLTRTVDGIFVGASFYCPSIQDNEGSLLAEYQAELEEMAADLPLVGAQPLVVWQDVVLEWSAYRELEEFLLARSDLEPALAQGLWSLAQFSLQPHRPLSEYLAISQAALEPPEEPLVLMQSHWFKQLTGQALKKRGPAPPEPLQHYLRSLLWRKALLGRRNLLGNLALLYLVPDFYRFWYAQTGSVSQTLDQCEFKIVTHPNNLDEQIERMGNDFRDQLDAVVP